LNAVQLSRIASLSPDVEYSAASFLISHRRTVGAGACAGCDVPVCLILQLVTIFTPDFQLDAYLASGANGPTSQVATWQTGAVATNLRPEGAGSRAIIGDCVLANTPTRAPTWGAVKALYR